MFNIEGVHWSFEGLSRYGTGTGAFLLPVYGAGELPQAFCRVAAVAGAVYVLRQGIGSFLIDPESGVCHGLLTCSGQVRYLHLLLTYHLLRSTYPALARCHLAYRSMILLWWHLYARQQPLPYQYTTPCAETLRVPGRYSNGIQRHWHGKCAIHLNL